MPYIQEVCVAGNTIEVNKYYSVRWHSKGEIRSEKTDHSSEAMQRINQRMAGRNLRRLLNTNFVDGDFLVRLDFHKTIPKDSKEMQDLISKSLRKIKAEYAKKDLTLKYVYVKEIGKRGGRHIHMVMSRCPTEILRHCWPHGGIHIDPLSSNGQYGKIAEYFIKYAARTEETEGKLLGKRWYGSRNLTKPKITKKVIQANKFSLGVKKKKGYYLQKESYRHDVSELTGYEYLSYTLIKSVQTERNG